MNSEFGVRLFLSRLETLLDQKRIVFKPRNRNKTLSFLLDNDLTSDDAFEIVRKLEEQHYYSGPETDRDGTEGTIMVFLYPYEDLGIDLYIKLKIWTSRETGEEGAVLSFHEEGKHYV